MRILSNLSVSGLLGLNSVSDANTDTDKFLVLDSSGIVRYRTGSEVFSDIGAGGAVTSVGLTMPSAFAVSSSPVTGSGTISVTGAGNATQYIRGDGQLATLPTNGSGGGASVSYYLNGSINQGTIGGVTYYEMNNTPIIGAGTDFSRSSNGYIASFLTDANDPALLNIPAGNWNFETYFQASSGGGSPTFYIELYKYDGTTFTLIASNSATPKLINDGTNIEAYFSALAVPQTTLTLTDRLAVRIYVTTSGRTITLHTQNGHLCQVITTFTTGLTALNGLTSQVQYLATGTSGTDFNISSVTATHTFNLPTASATNRGALSSADWTAFNSKQNALTLTTTGSSGSSTLVGATLNVPTYTLSGLGGVPTSRQLTINGTAYDLSADRSWSVGTHTGNLTTGYVPKATGITSLTDSLIYDNGSAIGINTASPYESSAFKLDVNGGVIIKNTSGTAAQLILINSNPATGGNNGFVQLSAGGNTSTAFGQWQTYYGMSVAAGALRLQPAGGQVLIGTTTTSAFTTDINGTLRVSGQLTLGSTISNNTYVYTMPGASGTLALVSDIPSLSGYVPTSRTLTINGVSYDLSADRSWTIAAGVSAVQAGSGISVSTSSGVVTVVNTITNTNQLTNGAGYITGITSGMVTTALGYTPYNATNPNGYITGYTETDTLASVTARGASTSTRTTFTEVGATREGSDSVAVGPWFRWTNLAESRQMLTQLNASFGLTTWAYNGSAWSSIYTLTQTGAATFSSSVTAGGNFTATADGGAGGLRLTLNNTGAGEVQYALLSGGSAGTGVFGIRNGSTGTNLFLMNGTGAATFSGEVTSTVDSSGASIRTQNNGTGARWYGRIGSFNSSSDKSAFLATYASVAVVGAHNNALSAWADLYVNTVDGTGGGVVRMPSTTYINGYAAVYASGTWSITATGNVASRAQSNWNDSTVINNVIGLMAWKNYGNNHVIFDASQGVSPSGGGVSQTNATVAWSASYPTLMGWNGTSSYGVRVDSARVADSAGSAATATTATNFNNGYAYSSGSTVYVDTLESINTNDWLELTYYGGLGVRIGTGTNGSKALYAGSLYDAGNRVYSAGNPQVNISGNAATATAAEGVSFITQPNSTWAGRIQLGGNGGGGAATVAVVQATNGNLHMDAGSGNHIYLNYYNNGTIYLNGGTYNISSNGSQYNGNSATATTAARATRANGNFYIDDNYGNTVVGVYTSTRYQGVFAMGDAYKLPADGTTTGNLYGLAWSHPNAGGVASNLNDHGLLVINNGVFAAAISSSIRAATDMRAPIFYDSNDTTYYLDPNGTSNLQTWTADTAARLGRPRYWTNRWAIYNTANDHMTGTNGWGMDHGGWDTAWKGGFSGWDIWGSSTGHPQGSGYVHAQGIISGQHAASSDGSTAYGWMMVGAHNATENRYWLRGKWGGSTSGWVEMVTSGNISSQTVSNSDMVDGYHASNFLGYNGNSYYQVNTWLQMNGTHGIYYPSYNGAHFYVNTTSSYTQFRLDGSRGGYGGIWDSYSAVHGIMYDSAGNGGVYRESSSRWYWYHLVANNCMGINTSTTSASYGLYVSGGIYSTGDIVAYSDERKKTNIITINNSLEKILKLRGVYYERTDDETHKRQVGVIAQEMNKVLPEAVTYASDIDEYGVQYGNVVGVLIEAIKEQQGQIEDLKSKLDAVTK